LFGILAISDDVGDDPVYSGDDKDEASSDEDDMDDEEEGDEEDEYDSKTVSSSGSPSDSKSGKRPGTPPNQKLDVRAKLAANLYLLNGVQLGHVISVLEKKCPEALETEPLAVPEKMEILIDKIQPPALFNSISQFVADNCNRKRAAPANPRIVDVSNRRKR
jgi:hypothetical protein